MVQVGEPVFIETFIPEPSVEGFDVGVLIGLAWLNQKQLNTSLVGPAQHGFAAELFAVIGPDSLG